MKVFSSSKTSGILLAACSTFIAIDFATAQTPILKLRFNEGAGTQTTNTGSSGGIGIFTQQNGGPAFSTNIPTGTFAPAANVSSIDFAAIGGADGNRSVDFAPATISPTIGLSAFTLTGWLNLRSSEIGGGGNRIFSSWSGEGVDSGFELVQESNGRLRFSVNEAPDFAGPGPFSSAGKLSINAATPASNWVFFAVTYNANDLANAGDGVVNYYFGNGSSAAVLDLTATYDRGIVKSQDVGESGTLTIGNFSTDVVARTATGGGSRVLRGLIDEVQVYSGVLTQTQIQAVQTVPEPGSALLCVLGLATLATRRRRTV